MSSGTERLWELLSAYIDGEVTDSERTEVERLLAENRQAADLFTRLSTTRNMLSGMQQFSAPARIRHNVSHAIRSNRSFFARLRRMLAPHNLRMPILSYAGGLLVIALVVFLTTLFTETSIAPTTEQFADAQGGETEGSLHEDAPADDFALSMEKDSAKKEAGSQAPAPAEEEELLADSDSGSAHRGRATSNTERRMMPAQPSVGIAAAPEPVIVSTASRPPMYRAEVIQAYQDSSRADEATSAAAENDLVRSDTYIASNGQTRRFDFAAPKGDDANPVIELVDLGAIGMPSVDFPYFHAAATGSVLINGTIHVAADGHIVSYRLAGPFAARELIDLYAAHLAGTRMMPARRVGRPISVLYNFIATIYRIEEPID